MEITNNLILPALILVPFIAGFICWLVDKLDKTFATLDIALIGMLITLGLGLAFCGNKVELIAMRWVQKSPTWSAEFYLPWIQSLGIGIHLAVDGLIVTHGVINSVTWCTCCWLFMG